MSTNSLQRLGVKILAGMYMVSKSLKIYDPSNVLVRDQTASLLQEIHTLILGEEEAMISLRESTLFLNGEKVRFSFSNYYLFKFINQAFRRWEIGDVIFLSGLDEKELTLFLLGLNEKPKPGAGGFMPFMRYLQSQNISHIRLERIQKEDTKRSEKRAKKMFFLGIAHLRETFDRMKKEEKIGLSTTRRLIQSLSDHIGSNENFIYGLTTIKNYDEYTLNHSINVCILSISLGKRLGLDRNELVELGISAFFHDFGKTEIPKDILSKPGKLGTEEREIIEQHPHLGAEKLIPLMATRSLPLRAINVAMEHHVREDLTGYPRYSKKRHVNLYSKIVKICDFFDALTTERPYRKRAFTPDETLQMMMEKSGVEFDPIILKVFAGMVGTYPVGTLVLLDTGEAGIVVEIPSEPLLASRPKVKIIADSSGRKIDGNIVDLSEKNEDLKTYRRSIVKSLDPGKYNIRVGEYFLVQAQERRP